MQDDIIDLNLCGGNTKHIPPDALKQEAPERLRTKKKDQIGEHLDTIAADAKVAEYAKHFKDDTLTTTHLNDLIEHLLKEAKKKGGHAMLKVIQCCT